MATRLKQTLTMDKVKTGTRVRHFIVMYFRFWDKGEASTEQTKNLPTIYWWAGLFLNRLKKNFIEALR